MKIAVTGAGGFIGSHLVERLKRDGHRVRAIDVEMPAWSESPADQFVIADLRNPEEAEYAVSGVERVYHLAADMGGMGYIQTHDAVIMRDNALIDINVLEAARRSDVKRLLFTSSACVYPEYRQLRDEVEPLRESMVFPAEPQDGYGWEKLYTELLCKYFFVDFGLETRVVRLHNVYGERGTYTGGREKAPAALCRKIATLKHSKAIYGTPSDYKLEIWGDGRQVRSFLHVDDCVDGLLAVMNGDNPKPFNIGSEEAVTINDLADTIASIAGINVENVYINGPTGVRSRNSDSFLAKKLLGWEPKISLDEGLIRLYAWVEEQVLAGASLYSESALPPSVQ